MKAISRMLVFAILVASLTGCATGTGFRPGAGERVLDTTLKGVAVGAVGGLAIGVLGEVFGGGDDRRGVVYDQRGGYGGGYGHGGYGYGQYNSPAEARNARLYRQQQWEEEERRLDAIHAERYGRRR